MADPVAFALRGATKRYGEAGLGPVDLELTKGHTTAVIGPSGCGKSTLLRLLLGLLHPDAGTVRFGDAAVAVDESARLKMGYVIQDGGLFPHLTAAGNAGLVARWLGWDRPRIQARLDELARLTRFPADGLARFPTELSGGQRQRVGIMRALFLDPEVLLLDEPLGALDPLVRADLQEELKDIFAKLGKTVILVTHDLAEAGFLAERVLLMKDGFVAQEGTYRDLVDHPADDFVKRFVGAQRMP